MATTKKILKMKQIEVAQFQSRDGNLSYSTLALGEDGAVYRYDPGCNGWVKWSMVLAQCATPHRR